MFKFQCPHCGSEKALVAKITSIPYLLEIIDGPSLMLDFPDKDDPIVGENNFNINELKCGACGNVILRIDDMATLTATYLEEEGFIVFSRAQGCDSYG